MALWKSKRQAILAACFLAIAAKLLAGGATR